nr:hypothetical protein [Desulfuromonadales bacterium]
NLILLGVLVIVTGALVAGAYFWSPPEEFFSPPILVVAIIVFGAGFGYLVQDLKSREQA